jgi:hypothetical protein
VDKDDIIKMAKEAGIKQAIETPHLLMVHELERFAALVAAHEREACAKLAEEPYEFTSEEAHRIASAIRARGEQ